MEHIRKHVQVWNSVVADNLDIYGGVTGVKDILLSKLDHYMLEVENDGKNSNPRNLCELEEIGLV